MATYSYAELEGLWINAGGSRALAPIMAAIALAESGGNPAATNPHDNNGLQTSWGLWQLSNGTHAQPVANILSPEVNAQQAVKKYKAQGLQAWGTYTSGAYKKFLKSDVSPVSSGSTPTTNDESQAGFSLPSVGGDVGGAIGKGLADALTSFIKPLLGVVIWGTEAMLGIGLIIFGVAVAVANSKPVKENEEKIAGAIVGSKTGSAPPQQQPHQTEKPLIPSTTETKQPTPQVKVAHSQAEVRALRRSGYTGKIRHDY